MSGPQPASVQPRDEGAPAEADPAGSQAGGDVPRSGRERIGKPRRRRIRRSVVAVLVAERVARTAGRISAKRLLPAARAARVDVMEALRSE